MSRSLPMGKSFFLVAFVVVVALTLCLPFDFKQIPTLAKAITSHSKVSITGNSVLQHTSRCDLDSRSLVSLLATDMQQPILDLSFYGQSLSEATNYAALSLKNPHVQTLIFPVSLFQFLDWDTDPIRDYAFYRLLNPDLDAASLEERVQSSGRLSGQQGVLQQPFDYDGVHYPDYDGVKAQYMSYERDMMRCPESDGVNLKFVAANLHHTLIEHPIVDKALSLVASLGMDAARRHKAMLVVILPIDFDLLAKLAIPGIDPLHAKVNRVVQTLRAAGVNVVDLSETLQNSDFADHWCACGHLVETGRLKIASKIIQNISVPTQSVAVYSQ